MQRRTAISERTGGRFWGDIDPYLSLGSVDIMHFICVVCGNISAYQLKPKPFKKQARRRPLAAAASSPSR